MLQISLPAAARMAHLLVSRTEDAVLRIIFRKERLRLSVSRLRPGDKTFAHEDRVVLALDSRIARSLDRRQLDLRDTDSGPRLRLRASRG